MEVRHQSRLRWPVVVGGDGHQAVRTGPLCGTRAGDGVRGVVGAYPRDHPCAIPYRFDYSGDEVTVLGIGLGRRFTGGAVDDEAVMSQLIDQVGRQRLRTIEVLRPV